jgi:uncharacterized membrane protein YgaE (UPF0421/DUF939 family)
MALDVLRSLHRHENDFRRVPEDLHNLIQDQLEYLINYHEQLLMKFSGKTRSDLPTELTDRMSEKRKSLSEGFMAYYEQDKGNYQHWLHLFPAVALLIDYHENLIHLNKLIDSFLTYHQDRNQLHLKET